MGIDLEPKELIYAIGLLLTFIVGVINFYISWVNSKQTAFVNSVTAARIEWMNLVRNKMTEFCTACHMLLTQNNGAHSHIRKTRFLFTLMQLLLNRGDNFDRKIIDQMAIVMKNAIAGSKEIIQFPNKHDEIEEALLKDVNYLIYQTQDLLKLEWEGVKEESAQGKLSRERKQELYDKYLRNSRRKIH